MEERPSQREDSERDRALPELFLARLLDSRWQLIRVIVWALSAGLVCIAALLSRQSTLAAVALVSLAPWLTVLAVRAWVGERARAHRLRIKLPLSVGRLYWELRDSETPSVSESGLGFVLAALSRVVFLSLLALLGAAGGTVGVVRLAERNVLLLAIVPFVVAFVALVAMAYRRATEESVSYSAPLPSVETRPPNPRRASAGSASTPTPELRRAIADDAELDRVARRLAELFEAADQDQIETATRAHDPDQIATALGISAEELKSLINTVLDRARDHGRQFPELHHLGRRLGIY